MSSGGIHQGGGGGGRRSSRLHVQLDDAIAATGSFLDALHDKLAQYDRDRTCFTPASEYLKNSIEHVQSKLDEFKGDSERAGTGKLSHEDREALAMSLDALNSAVESLTHFAQSFDTHRRSLECETTHKQSAAQPPSGSETEGSVEKLVRSTLSHACLGFDKLQRGLNEDGDDHQEETKHVEDTKAPWKPARVRRNSISIDAFGDQPSGVGEEGEKADRADRGYVGHAQFANQTGPVP